MDRREFLSVAASLTATMAFSPSREQSAPRTRLILLGTGAGPRPRKGSSGSAQVIIAEGRLYVVDCGDGVARQLALAGASLTALRNVFITHHHSDHNADYGNLLLLSWASGLQQRVDTWGPPPIERMTQLFLEMNATDIETRMADEGFRPLAPLIHAHDVTGAGLVMQDDVMKVTCARVSHPKVKDAYAYRFDAPDRSIVISGDTVRSPDLVKLAKGADVLVHEAVFPEAIERMVSRIPNGAALGKHIMESHTTAEECGRIATDAGVKTLVLSHLAPAEDPLLTESMWAEAAGRHFKGRVVVGRDLLEI